MKKQLSLIILVIAFVAAAGLLWLPFESYTVLYGTRPGGAVPAGEIRAEFQLAQQVRPPETVEIDNRQPHCFAIRFATYARSNEGELLVRWRQGSGTQIWQVAAADLIDNTYRHFCPDAAFAADRPFHVEIAGLTSPPGDAPTLWLVSDTRFGTARVPDGSPQGKSAALQGSTRNQTDAGEILRINDGAFLIGWLCTLVIGLLALMSTFGTTRDADDP